MIGTKGPDFEMASDGWGRLDWHLAFWVQSWVTLHTAKPTQTAQRAVRLCPRCYAYFKAGTRSHDNSKPERRRERFVARAPKRYCTTHTGQSITHEPTRRTDTSAKTKACRNTRTQPWHAHLYSARRRSGRPKFLATRLCGSLSLNSERTLGCAHDWSERPRL